MAQPPGVIDWHPAWSLRLYLPLTLFFHLLLSCRSIDFWKSGCIISKPRCRSYYSPKGCFSADTEIFSVSTKPQDLNLWVLWAIWARVLCSCPPQTWIFPVALQRCTWVSSSSCNFTISLVFSTSCWYSPVWMLQQDQWAVFFVFMKSPFFPFHRSCRVAVFFLILSPSDLSLHCQLFSSTLIAGADAPSCQPWPLSNSN